MIARNLDRADLAQEIRLLRDVIDALSGAESLTDVLRAIGQGIKNVVPYGRWQEFTIALCGAEAGWCDLYRMHGKLANAYWGNVGKGAFVAARELGAALSFELGNGDPDFQTRALDAAVRRGVDGVAIAPIDPFAIEPAIARARAAGVPVVTIDTPPAAGSSALLYIGTDNVAAGRTAGEVMRQLLPAGGAIGTMVYYIQALNSQQRLEGFAQGLGQGPMTLLPPFDVQGMDEHGEQRARALLAERPDIVGAFGVCAMNGPGWAAAAEATGRAGTLKIVGFDMSPDTVELLKSGAIHAVVAQREGKMGSQSVEILCRMAVEGLAETLGRYPASHIVDTGVDVVTLEGNDWSISLADYLVNTTSRGVDQSLRAAISRRGRPLQLVMIGMDTPADADLAVERLRLADDALLAEVLARRQTQVLRELPGQGGVRVGVPLFARSEPRGVLSFESATLDTCTQAELAQFERIARAVALLIDNSLLISALDERGRQLHEANEHQEQLIETVRELSSPVVPIAPGVLVVPLVGTIDSRRAIEFTTTLLDTSSRLGARVVLIDITGVQLIDTAVAASLLGTARAAALIGAEVVFVGISPPVAQTLVSLGVDFTGVATHANLQSGFAYALARTGGTIVYR